eukprot:TRINITY_DN772_c0_g3_i1.p1 TRINITY_DN772_c0_g3~~TRINITY_DN772_c0_g3_i1.p1  ORF type:complete len:590 (+),score=169.21 TRINITY_DN772_c0_g3_i1:171-1772(+)
MKSQLSNSLLTSDGSEFSASFDSDELDLEGLFPGVETATTSVTLEGPDDPIVLEPDTQRSAIDTNTEWEKILDRAEGISLNLDPTPFGLSSVDDSHFDKKRKVDQDVSTAIDFMMEDVPYNASATKFPSKEERDIAATLDLELDSGTEGSKFPSTEGSTPGGSSVGTPLNDQERERNDFILTNKMPEKECPECGSLDFATLDAMLVCENCGLELEPVFFQGTEHVGEGASKHSEIVRTNNSGRGNDGLSTHIGFESGSSASSASSSSALSKTLYKANKELNGKTGKVYNDFMDGEKEMEQLCGLLQLPQVVTKRALSNMWRLYELNKRYSQSMAAACIYVACKMLVNGEKVVHVPRTLEEVLAVTPDGNHKEMNRVIRLLTNDLGISIRKAEVSDLIERFMSKIGILMNERRSSEEEEEEDPKLNVLVKSIRRTVNNVEQLPETHSGVQPATVAAATIYFVCSKHVCKATKPKNLKALTQKDVAKVAGKSEFSVRKFYKILEKYGMALLDENFDINEFQKIQKSQKGEKESKE